MPRRSRYLTILVTVILLVATGGLALSLTVGAARSAETILEEARMQLEETVAAVVGQGLSTGLVLSMNAAAAEEWSLEPGDPADAARLERFVATSPLIDHGAVLVSLSGEHLNRVTTADPLPAAGDGVYDRLRPTIGQREPLFTSVVATGHPTVGMAVPILGAGEGPPSAVIVGFFRLEGSLLQQYTDPVRQGRTGISHILDSDHVVIASTDRSRVGRALPGEMLRELVSTGTPDLIEYTDDHGDAWVASFAPTVSAWGVLTTQHAGEFYGPIRTGRTRTQLAIVGLMMVASLGLGLLFHRREQALDQLEVQANHDTLTGLANRHRFTASLEDRLAAQRGSGRATAVMFCDLDGFKAINDEHGHEVGDRVLQEVAERLTGCVRGGDLVARMGGDEFTILLDGADDATVRQVADRIVDAFADPIGTQGRWPELGVGISIGVAMAVDRDVTDLLRSADLAMYEAKLRPGSAWVLSERVPVVGA